MENRNHLIKCDYGANDYYKYFTENNLEKVSRSLYGQVIKEFNGFLRDRMSDKGADIVLPFRLGRAELKKKKTEVKIDEDGKVINNLPTNWKATRDLWKENAEAKEKNIKIKFTNEHTGGYTFKISYLKGRATFRNKSIYKIRFNRTLKRNLSKSIFKGNIDAFINPY
tara:strand:+ start:197 stop:700 length:504 start_codon:yes stop_codon:yes gene_type:complete